VLFRAGGSQKKELKNEGKEKDLVGRRRGCNAIASGETALLEYPGKACL